MHNLSYDEAILKGWYGITAVRLADRRDGAARNTSTHLHGSELSAPLAPELHGDRQPRSQSGRLRAVQRGGPARSATSRRGRLHVGPIYNVNPDKFGVTDDFRTYSPAYGNVSQVYNGVDFSVNARLRNGLQVQAGTSTGQTVVDACEVRDKLPEQVSTGAASAGGIPYNPANPFCHIAPGITTRFTSAGSPCSQARRAGGLHADEQPRGAAPGGLDHTQRGRPAVARVIWPAARRTSL